LVTIGDLHRPIIPNTQRVSENSEQLLSCLVASWIAAEQ
jgi:hypothetical protein